MHHHQAHQQRADVIAEGKAQGDGRHNGDRAGADRAHRRQQRRNPEHDPGDRADPALDRTHGHAHQPVDRAVVLRQGEQPGDADQGQEQPARKAGDDILGGLRGQQRADQKGADKGQDAHVDRPDGRDHEHQHQRIDGNQMWCHAAFPLFLHDLRRGSASTRILLPQVLYARHDLLYITGLLMDVSLLLGYAVGSDGRNGIGQCSDHLADQARA